MLRVPTRSELSGAEPFRRGRPVKADLLTLDLGQGAMIVKDFAAKAWWVRWIGRVQIRAEHRAYLQLDPMPGLPRLVGRIDAYALAVEKIEGAEPLGLSDLRESRGPDCFRQLCDIVSRMRAKGVVHLDIRGGDNVLVRPDGAVRIVDLASAMRMRSGGLAYRLFFRFLQAADRSALLKWKRILKAGDYTEEELAFLRRHARWRALWPFNPKHGKKRTEVP